MTSFTKVSYNEKLHGHLPEAHKNLILQGEFYQSDEHLVIKRMANVGQIEFWHLSLRRKDNGKVGWLEKQKIKNEIIGEQHEGFELYPPESEKIDTCNQYHIWVWANPDARIGLDLYSKNKRGE